jgi:shikimate dehydrogenase
VFKFCVIGNPVKKSKSPWIHSEFAKQLDLAVDYVINESPLDQFEKTVRDFQQAGGRGCNITVPFKQEAFQLTDELSERAQLAGAVNTFLFREDGTIFGDNTDGFGLVKDITGRLAFDLKGKRVLILGAGGAARGILGPLLEELPESVTVANRTLANAEKLAERFAELGEVRACQFSDLNDQQFDVLIDTTSVEEIAKQLPTSLELSSNGLCYDIKYREQATPIMRWAEQKGVSQISDGMGMLIEQAAGSFELWTGLQPKTASLF